jgi:hypothetical protein
MISAQNRERSIARDNDSSTKADNKEIEKIASQRSADRKKNL